MSDTIQKVTFLYTSSSLDQPVKGTITVSGSNATISLKTAGQPISAGTKKDARFLASKIIAANFRHDAVISIAKLDSDIGALLHTALKDVKDRYFDEVRKYCAMHFDYIEAELAAPLETWYQKFNVGYQYPEAPNGGGISTPIPSQESLLNDSHRKMMSKRTEFVRLKQKGLDGFESKNIRDTDIQFTQVIARLKARLIKKGIDDECKITMTTSKVDGNYEIIVKNQEEVVRVLIILYVVPRELPYIRYIIR